VAEILQNGNFSCIFFERLYNENMDALPECYYTSGVCMPDASIRKSIEDDFSKKGWEVVKTEDVSRVIFRKPVSKNATYREFCEIRDQCRDIY
jgi:hypothetical protein